MASGEGAQRRLDEARRRCYEAWAPRWEAERAVKGAPEPEYEYVVSFRATESEACRVLQFIKERRTFGRAFRRYPPGGERG